MSLAAWQVPISRLPSATWYWSGATCHQVPGANSSGATCYLSGAQCQLLHLPGSTAARQIQGARFQLHQILASAVKELYFMIQQNQPCASFISGANKCSSWKASFLGNCILSTCTGIFSQAWIALTWSATGYIAPVVPGESTKKTAANRNRLVKTILNNLL